MRFFPTSGDTAALMFGVEYL